MEERVSCTVKEFAEYFNFEQVTGDEKALYRKIRVPNTNRPGLELTGFYDHAEHKRIVIIGNKETAYLDTMDRETKIDRFNKIAHDKTPLILITSGNDCPEELFQIANRKNFPVFKTDAPSSAIMVEMVTYLDEVLARRTNVHGVLMNVFGKGVLIIGDSGMGKSEVALDLILRGHSLIADDRVDVSRVKNVIIGTAPELLRGMLEIRGIGIIDVMQMFGVRAYLEKEEVDFVVEFKKWNDNDYYLRAGTEEQTYYETLGLDIPLLLFPVKEGRNLAVLVESAVQDFMLKQRGVNTAQIFDDKVIDFIKRQSVEETSND